MSINSDKDENYSFLILMQKKLKTDSLIDAFLMNFNHYVINRILYRLLGRKGMDDPGTIFVSEMLSNHLCQNCKHFGKASCWIHPRNFISLFLKAQQETHSNSKSDDRTLLNNLLEIFSDEATAALDSCPAANTLLS